jgi:hypothetical protein
MSESHDPTISSESCVLIILVTWHVIITRSTQMRSLVVPFRLQTKSHSFVHAEIKTANQTAMCCTAEKHSYLER